MARALSLLSWNINGKVVDKGLVLSELLSTNKITFLQEQFLSDERKNLLSISQNSYLLFHPAKMNKSRGRPSGGSAIISQFPVNLLESNDHFIAVEFSDLICLNVYLPTNYYSSQSENKFINACKKLASFVKGVSKRPNARVLIAGDFDCDLTDSSSPRTQLFLNSLPPSYSVADKTETFTFIGVLSATFNLEDFLLGS